MATSENKTWTNFHELNSKDLTGIPYERSVVQNQYQMVIHISEHLVAQGHTKQNLLEMRSPDLNITILTTTLKRIKQI